MNIYVPGRIMDLIYFTTFSEASVAMCLSGTTIDGINLGLLIKCGALSNVRRGLEDLLKYIKQ